MSGAYMDAARRAAGDLDDVTLRKAFRRYRAACRALGALTIALFVAGVWVDWRFLLMSAIPIAGIVIWTTPLVATGEESVDRAKRAKVNRSLSDPAVRVLIGSALARSLYGENPTTAQAERCVGYGDDIIRQLDAYLRGTPYPTFQPKDPE